MNNALIPALGVADPPPFALPPHVETQIQTQTSQTKAILAFKNCQPDTLRGCVWPSSFRASNSRLQNAIQTIKTMSTAWKPMRLSDYCQGTRYHKCVIDYSCLLAVVVWGSALTPVSLLTPTLTLGFSYSGDNIGGHPHVLVPVLSPFDASFASLELPSEIAQLCCDWNVPETRKPTNCS